jgi:hypothetical protein
VVANHYAGAGGGEGIEEKGAEGCERAARSERQRAGEKNREASIEEKE